MYRILVAAPLLLLAALAPAQKQDTAKRTRTIKLTERAGVARTQLPVETSVRFERTVLKDPSSVRLFRVDKGQRTPVPSQVLSTTPHDATDSFAPVAQTFVQLAFLADVPANGTVTYEVALDGPAAPTQPGALKVTGTGVGKTVDTGNAFFDLHKGSGQLLAFSPRAVNQDRLVFLQHKDRGELPIHWNPDIWLTGGRWGHTSDWNTPVAFDPAKHKSDTPPVAADKNEPYFYREWSGPLLYRQTRWGRMPFVPQVDVSVTYTFHAGAPFLMVDSLMEFREGLSVHAVRNAELVFSRHQFDTAAWVTRDGKLHTAPAYDAADRDRSFKDIARLPADVPCVALASEGKGYGVAYLTLGLTNLNKRTGHAADEGAHFSVRDYDEHGKGSPANFLYFVRPVVYRDGYLPTAVAAGALYAEKAAVVVFPLNKDPARKYDDLLRWQKVLANPVEVLVD